MIQDSSNSRDLKFERFKIQVIQNSSDSLTALKNPPFLDEVKNGGCNRMAL